MVVLFGRKNLQKNNFKFLSVLIFITYILLNCFIFVGCNDTTNEKYYYRSVSTTNDIIVEQKTNLSMSLSFVVRPQNDIDDLLLGFSFFDANDNPIIAKSKELGNVNNGGEYNIQLDFLDDDFSFSQFSKIAKFNIDIIRGRIKELQNTTKSCSNHKFNDGTITISSSCHTMGEKILTCSKCNYKKVENISYKEHNYILWKTIREPTCIQTGQCWDICKNCAVRTQRTINPTLICIDNNRDGRCDFCNTLIN